MSSSRMRMRSIPATPDAHSVGPGQVLALVRRLGGRVGRVLIVGCEPLRLDQEPGLSPIVAAAVDEAIPLIERLVASALAAAPTHGGELMMCLAIPAMIVAMGVGTTSRDRRGVERPADGQHRSVEGGTARAGDWVLIHVGFAMSRISSRQAEEQLKLLRMLGEDAEAMQELEGYTFE